MVLVHGPWSLHCLMVITIKDITLDSLLYINNPRPSVSLLYICRKGTLTFKPIESQILYLHNLNTLDFICVLCYCMCYWYPNIHFVSPRYIVPQGNTCKKVYIYHKIIYLFNTLDYHYIIALIENTNCKVQNSFH